VVRGVEVIVGMISFCLITMGRYWTTVASICAREVSSKLPKYVNRANVPAMKTST
jgi:hypothetical protein